VAQFVTTPNGKAGGIWMSGAGPAADAGGSIFFASGNGTFTANRGGKDFGDSVIKLTTGGGLNVADYFTPSDQSLKQSHDLDLGSGGTVLLPDQPGPTPHLLVASDKQGHIYVVNRDNMGRFNRTQNQIVQEISGAMLSSFGSPAYFNGTLYFVGAGNRDAGIGGGDVLKAFSARSGVLTGVPATGAFSYGYPGSTPSITANGLSNGIVWTLDNGGSHTMTPAVLRAYDAGNIADELYDSNQAGAQDQPGIAVKFAVPTVANGKVYVGGNGSLTVYGLLGPR
jgi:hypothetical protein